MPDERELAEGQMTGTTSSDLISTKQGEIAALAGIEPRRVLTTLAHRIDMAWMREAYRRTRKDGCCIARYSAAPFPRSSVPASSPHPAL